VPVKSQAGAHSEIRRGASRIGGGHVLQFDGNVTACNDRVNDNLREIGRLNLKSRKGIQ
jgi:hypothetical protein